jgi:AcrR family transcriptional regulator
MEAKTRKSVLTRAAILDAGIDIAVRHGLGAVTVPSLAEKLKLSNSGVFSRIGSIETLRIALVDEYARRFLDEIFFPALKNPHGLDRLNAVIELWIRKICSGTGNSMALFEVTAFSMDQAAHDTRDILIGNVRGWRSMMMRTVMQAMAHGQLREDIDPSVLLFEIHCLVLGALYEYRIMNDANTACKAIASYRELIKRVSRPAAPG